MDERPSTSCIHAAYGVTPQPRAERWHLWTKRSGGGAGEEITHREIARRTQRNGGSLPDELQVSETQSPAVK